MFIILALYCSHCFTSAIGTLDKDLDSRIGKASLNIQRSESTENLYLQYCLTKAILGPTSKAICAPSRGIPSKVSEEDSKD